jgi:sortase A
VTRRSALAGLAGLLAAVAVWQLGAAGWIQAKAWLARGLIDAAWARTLAGEARVRPWPWADTWPVARLVAPDQGIGRLVLAGAHGRSLAFGPGHLSGSAAPGAPGSTVVTGHRDTHFRFLAELAPGSPLRLQAADGAWHDYRVAETVVVHKDRATLADDGRDRLVLITCYPFDALRPGTPWRYIVVAEPPDGRFDSSGNGAPARPY